MPIIDLSEPLPSPLETFHSVPPARLANASVPKLGSAKGLAGLTAGETVEQAVGDLASWLTQQGVTVLEQSNPEAVAIKVRSIPSAWCKILPYESRMNPRPSRYLYSDYVVTI